MKPLLCLITALTLAIYLAIACAPGVEVAVFTYHRHPDFPRNQFLNGQLSVLEPSYARSYLYVAYRQLSGVGFNPPEREQIKLYWNDRASGAWDKTSIDWSQRWQQARKKIPGVATPTEAGKPVNTSYGFQSPTYSWQLNCADDAFRTAIITLQSRSARYGATNPSVKDWVHAQDVVFSNCDLQHQAVPDAAPSNAPAWLHMDRDYQIAAALLYGKKHEAVDRFRSIAADPASPWQPIAPYLVARALAREVEPAAPSTKPAPEATVAYQTAETQIQLILADRKLAPIYGMSRALLRRVRERVAPQIAVRELAKAVMQRGDEGSLRQDLWDYTSLLDHFFDDPFSYRSKEEQAAFEKEALTLPRQDEVTDWIATMQSKRPVDTMHAIERWRRENSLPWLVAAMSRISGTDPAMRQLVQASSEISPESPAYWTLAFHRNRLRIEVGDQAGVREELARILEPAPAGLPKSGLNRFLSLRMQAATNLAGFLTFAQRVPVMVTDALNYGETPGGVYDPPSSRIDRRLPRWDRDSIKVLNERTPLSYWNKALEGDQLPAHLRQEFSLTTLARATLLDDDQSLRAVAPRVATVLPEARKYMLDVAGEPTGEARHFAAVYFLLHYANVRPYLISGVSWHQPNSPAMDSTFNNWWCELSAPYELDWTANDRTSYFVPSEMAARSDPDIAARRSAFLQSSDLEAGRRDFEKLAATGPAPNYLGAQTLAWVREHPDDPRIAEALSYVVRVGRYGCQDQQSWKYSRDAHTLLHTKYKATPWAKNTPYWFKTWYPRSQH